MELKQLVRPIKRWWWLILLATLLAMGSSTAATMQQPETYATKSTLMIGRGFLNDPNPNNTEFYLSQQLAGLYADIALRQPVRAAAMDALAMDWLPEYVVQPIPNTQLLEVIVTDTDPLRAQVVANELARQLILQGPTSSSAEEIERQQFIKVQLDGLQEQIKLTQEEIAAKRETVGTLISARQIADVEGQIEALDTKLTLLQSNYSGMLANSQEDGANSVQIFESAQLPEEPVGPNRLLTILLACALGLSLSIGTAFLLEYLDDRIKADVESADLSDLPILARVPEMPVKELDNQLIALARPRDPITEAYRILRTGVQFSNVDKPSRNILVTSSNPGEGKSTTAANLALVMAQAGHRVVLIDADWRRPVVHKLFGLNASEGITMIFAGAQRRGKQFLREQLERIIQPTTQRNLDVIASGPIPPNPSELLSSNLLRETIELIHERYDYVIFDSPPVLSVTDSIMLSAWMDDVLLAVYANKTRRADLLQTIARLREVNAHLVGVVVNRVANVGNASYDYYSRPVSAENETRRGRFRWGRKGTPAETSSLIGD